MPIQKSEISGWGVQLSAFSQLVDIQNVLLIAES
jgi:hypothetical protein